MELNLKDIVLDFQVSFNIDDYGNLEPYFEELNLDLGCSMIEVSGFGLK